MRIKKMVLENFKGVRFFEFEPNGQNVNVYGTNAAGKTTLYDAFLWLLFDKDSMNRKDFSIKTLDGLQMAIPYIDHSVYLETVDGLELKKVYKEKWTKKKGSATEEFSGHTTDYFVNGVPSKKSEYEEKIAEIADEKIFKLLTSPTFFNEFIEWKERRAILLDICGDIDADTVMNTNSDLKEIAEMLGKYEVEEARRIANAKKSEINKRLKEIPARIDEVMRGLPDVSTVDKSVLKQDLDALKQQREDIVSGEDIRKEMDNIRKEYLERCETKKDELSREISRMHRETLDKKTELQYEQKKFRDTETQLKALESDRENMLEKYNREKSREFKYEDKKTCPTCNQTIPESDLEQARAKALALFNIEKSDNLSAIAKKGQAIKEEMESKIDVRECTESRIAEIERSINCLESKMVALKRELSDVEQLSREYESDSRYITLNGKLEEGEDYTWIDERIAEVEKEIANIEIYVRGKERMSELKDEQKKLAGEYEQAEKTVFLLDEFVKTKVEMLEDRINDKFKLAKFKMFDIQINGGISETCETLFEGVPYSKGLNSAARINVGLDIINTLAEHYGKELPIFIDNRETVVEELLKTKGQMVGLVASKSDKKLRVEVCEDGK